MKPRTSMQPITSFHPKPSVTNNQYAPITSLQPKTIMQPITSM